MDKKMDKKKDNKIDKRCPRNLVDLPSTWCPAAVLRLKALRNSSKELTEEEESKLVGCPWAVSHQLSNYCFFKYMREFMEDSAIQDNDIAHMNCISVETVKKVEKQVIQDIRKSQTIQDIKSHHGSDKIFKDK